MNVRRVMGFSIVAAVVASFSLPTLLSAQNNATDQQPQVTITLLGSGKIRVDGDFTLEVPDRAASITGPTVATSNEVIRALGGTEVTAFSQGMTVELWGYVIEAESGAYSSADGPNQRLPMRDAVISHSD